MLAKLAVFCVVCISFFASPAHAKSDIISLVKKEYYGNDYCTDEQTLNRISSSWDSIAQAPDDSVWLAIGKANTLKYCYVEYGKAIKVLQDAQNQYQISAQPEPLAVLLVTLSTIHSEKNNYSAACELLSHNVFSNADKLQPMTNSLYQIQKARSCQELSPIEQYKKLLEIKQQTKSYKNQKVDLVVLVRIYNFLLENNEEESAIQVLKEISKLDDGSQRDSPLLLAFDYISLDRPIDARKFIAIYENRLKNTLSEDIHSREREDLTRVKMYQHYFVNDFEEAWPYAMELTDRLKAYRQYAGTGKVSIMKAIICLELGKKECVDRFVDNLENEVTERDWQEQYLPYFMAKYEARKNGIDDKYIDMLRDNWKSLYHKQQSSELLTDIAQLTQESIEAKVALAQEQKRRIAFERNTLIAFLSLLVIAIVYLFFMWRKQKVRAEVDALTKVLNRRATFSRINAATEPLVGKFHAMAIFDLDNFKQINDSYGHPVGDKVLCEFANLSKGLIRKEDVLGRVGGEEFVIFITNTTRESTIERIDLLRQKLCEMPIQLDTGEIISVSASIGISFIANKTGDISDKYAEADELLYQAKTNGKNCIVAAEV